MYICFIVSPSLFQFKNSDALSIFFRIERTLIHPFYFFCRYLNLQNKCVAAQFDNSSEWLKRYCSILVCIIVLKNVEPHSYCFFIVWQHFWSVSGGNNPVQEMFNTYLFTNIQDGLTSSLNICVSDKFKFYVIWLI